MWPWHRRRRDPRPFEELEAGLAAVTSKLERSTVELIVHLEQLKQEEAARDRTRPA